MSHSSSSRLPYPLARRMVFARWVPHSSHSQGHTMILSLLICTMQNYLNPTAHMVSVQRGKNIYKKKERKKDDSINPTVLVSRLSPDRTLRWSCIPPYQGKTCILCFAALVLFYSVSSWFMPLLPAELSDILLSLTQAWLGTPWNQGESPMTSRDIGCILDSSPHHRCFQRNVTEHSDSIFFFPLELTFFVVPVFSPVAEGSPSSKLLKDNIRGNMLHFCFSLLWKNTFSWAFGWPSFSLPSLTGAGGHRQLGPAGLCSAVPWVASEVTGTTASPYVHRPFEVTSKGLFAKGLQVQHS